MLVGLTGVAMAAPGRAEFTTVSIVESTTTESPSGRATSLRTTLRATTAPTAPATAVSTSATTSATPVGATTPTTVVPPPPAATPVPAVPPPAPVGAPAPAISSKKGAALGEEYPGNATSLPASGVSWLYNWSPRPPDTSGMAGVEFVPMIWGAANVNPQTLAAAQASGDTLLGFNEPDLAGQAEMSVEEALDLWPQLEGTGMRLVSPAVAFGGADPGGWLDRFMSGATQRGYRVDAIAVHWYGGDFDSTRSTGYLRDYLTQVHQRYGKPIWLTEYALIDFSRGAAMPTPEAQSEFIAESTEMLQSLAFVERYAWFSHTTPDSGGLGTGLFGVDGVPTPMGLAYSSAG